MSIQFLPNQGKDHVIKDLSRGSIPSHPPTGFIPLSAGENNSQIGQAAQQILHSSELGDRIPFTIDGMLYIGRLEPHYHSYPPKGETDTSKYPRPFGWHKGVSVFRSIKNELPTNESENYQPSNNISARKQLLRRIDRLFDDLSKEI